MTKYLFRKRSFDDEEYEQQVGDLKKRVIRFPVFVIAGLLLVAIVVGIIIWVNVSNNSLRVLVLSTAKSIESDGFE